MIAVVPVRDGAPTLGAEEAVEEASGRVVLVGSGTLGAAEALSGATADVAYLEAGDFRPGSWAAALAPHLAEEDAIILPASPDGRDLAPRLALALGRALHAPCTEIRPDRVATVRHGGAVLTTLRPTAPFVATLQPGARGTSSQRRPSAAVRRLEVAVPDLGDATVLSVTDPDPSAMELSEAPAIVAGGAGVGSAETMALLGRAATALGCSLGATRVVADAGWVPFERQIGTTGVVVDPDLYIAVGISGAVQHVTGIGQPSHVVSVNTDASCPMMALADLALVTDGPGFVAALAARLDLPGMDGRDDLPGTDDRYVLPGADDEPSATEAGDG